MVHVVLLTGFLGSGKTTLLNRMIAARAFGPDDVKVGGAGRLALVVNELGEVGIDGALLPSEMTRQVELPGGCICCVMNDDLDRTIVDLLASAPDVGTVVIETTGVAEPLPIAWAIEREPLASRVRLTAVLTLVDVLHFADQRPLSPAVDAQVAYADVVVLTKTDLASRDQVGEVRRLVAEIAPKAPVVQGTPEEVVAWLAGALEDPELRDGGGDVHVHVHDHVHNHVHGQAGGTGGSGRAHGVESVWVEANSRLDLEELCDALAELPREYVRIKGIVDTAEGWYVIHRVGLRVSSEPLARPEARPHGRIVALGPGVQRAPLAGCVERAVLFSQ